MPSADESARAALVVAGAAALALFFFRRPSRNFTWDELTTTNTGLPNQPNIEQRFRLILLARQVLQPLRDEFGPIRVTSAFRSGPVNAAVGGTGGNCVRSEGGKPCSLHTAGSAVDLYSMEGATAEHMATWLYLHPEIPIAEAIIEPTGHLHLGRDSGGAPGARRFLQTQDMRTYTAWMPSAPMLVS